WVLKTSVTGENIFAYPPRILPKAPHPFYYVDVWYYIPFARYFLNSVIVSLIAVIANVVFNAMAGYALTRDFPAKRFVLLLFLSCMMVPFQATIIPAYLITGRLGLLDTYWGLALPQFSTILLFLLAPHQFIRGLTSGATKGWAPTSARVRLGGSSSTGSCWSPRRSPWLSCSGMAMCRRITTASSPAGWSTRPADPFPARPW